VRILQRWIGQAGRYEHAVNTLLPEETKNDEQEALLETWETFRDALEEAVAHVDPFSAKLPKTEEEGHQKRVKDWLSRDKDGVSSHYEDPPVWAGLVPFFHVTSVTLGFCAPRRATARRGTSRRVNRRAESVIIREQQRVECTSSKKS
jgi:hypothetical protein